MNMQHTTHGRILAFTLLVLLLALLWPANVRAQDPCELACPPDSELVVAWQKVSAEIAATLAEQKAKGVLALDLSLWTARDKDITAALSSPDTLAVFVTRGLGIQAVAVNDQDYDLVWLDQNGWQIVAVDEHDYDLVFNDRGQGSTLAYDETGWDMVAVNDEGYDLLAVVGLSGDELKINDQDWDIVAVNNNDYDLVAVVGRGEGLENSNPDAWGQVAGAEEAHAWREYARVFEAWLPQP